MQIGASYLTTEVAGDPDAIRKSVRAVETWGRVKHHLAEQGKSANGFGAELLTLFAKDAQESADYLAKAKRLIDAG